MFEFEHSPDGRSLTIKVTEDNKFDITLATDFRGRVENEWKPGIVEVTIDFSNVEFIDSSGVGALVSVYKRIRPFNGTLRLLNPRPAVTSVIELVRMHRIFELVQES